MKKKRSIGKMAIITLVSLSIVFLIILSAIPPILMNDMVNTHVNFSRMYTGEEFDLTSEKIILKTSDGINIATYEVHVPTPKAVVIFISGIHNPSVTAFYGHSKMLMENGYASILMEMRAHGESEGDVISLGYKEYLDTKAVVDYIKVNPKYDNVPIVVFGVSMGGATAINSIGKISEIDALISLSAFSAWEDVFYDSMINMGVPVFYSKIQKPFVKLYCRLKYGSDTNDVVPKKQIKNIGDRRAFIIHSKDDSQVPYPSFERILEMAPPHVETWTREGDLHFIVGNSEDFTSPEKDEEYKEKIIGFLNKHFNSK